MAPKKTASLTEKQQHYIPFFEEEDSHPKNFFESKYFEILEFPATTIGGNSVPADTPTSVYISYPPIFKSESGNRYWVAGVEIPDVVAGTEARLFVKFGVVGGKAQISDRRIAINKSNRNIVEQSLLQLTHKYHHKMKKEGFYFSEADAARMRLATETKNTRPFPMNAGKYEEKTELVYPVCVQPKLDGVRMLVDTIEEPTTGELTVRYSSRERSDYAHLSEVFGGEVRELLNRLIAGDYATDPVIDGELIIPTGGDPDELLSEDFQSAVSAAKKYKGGLSDSAKKNLVYAVFSYYDRADPKESFCRRNHNLTTVFSESEFEKVVKVPTFSARSPEEILTAFENFKKRGNEGIMIYNPNAGYSPGKRVNDILKLKSFDDTEGVIVGVVAGEGSREEKAAVFEVEVLLNNNEILGKRGVMKMRPAATLEQRQEWLADPESVIGKRVTYTYQGFSRDGMPRFAVARAIRDYE